MTHTPNPRGGGGDLQLLWDLLRRIDDPDIARELEALDDEELHTLTHYLGGGRPG